MKRKKTEYCILYLKENILLFDVFNYIEELASETVDFMHEWNLVKDGNVIFKQKIIKNFLKKQINQDLNELKQHALKINCNIFSFFCKKSILNEWSIFFENPTEFIIFCKKICKKNLINFIENEEDKLFFQNVNGYFFNLPCLLPTGDDEEFIHNKIKKIKKTIDI